MFSQQLETCLEINLIKFMIQRFDFTRHASSGSTAAIYESQHTLSLRMLQLLVLSAITGEKSCDCYYDY